MRVCDRGSCSSVVFLFPLSLSFFFKYFFHIFLAVGTHFKGNLHAWRGLFLYFLILNFILKFWLQVGTFRSWKAFNLSLGHKHTADKRSTAQCTPLL